MTRFYFDHNATTPVAPEVLDAMLLCLDQEFGNASSIHHYGQKAKQRLETARRRVAGLIHAQPQEIVFLSGGTEADNLAVLGVVRRGPGRASMSLRAPSNIRRYSVPAANWSGKVWKSRG